MEGEEFRGYLCQDLRTKYGRFLQRNATLVVGMLCNEDSETKVKKVNCEDFSERMRTLVEKRDCHLVSLLSALLTLAIVLPWSSFWIKMITMMIVLI